MFRYISEKLHDGYEKASKNLNTFFNRNNHEVWSELKKEAKQNIEIHKKKTTSMLEDIASLRKQLNSIEESKTSVNYTVSVGDHESPVKHLSNEKFCRNLKYEIEGMEHAVDKFKNAKNDAERSKAEFSFRVSIGNAQSFLKDLFGITLKSSFEATAIHHSKTNETKAKIHTPRK